MVLDNPRAWLRHRTRVFRAILAANSRPVTDPVWRVHVELQYITEPRSYVAATGIQASIGDGLRWVADDTPLFRPWIYFVLAFAFAVLARRQLDVLALLASGVLYELTLLVICPTTDFRYSHWMIACTTLAGIVLFVRRLRSARSDVAAR